MDTGDDSVLVSECRVPILTNGANGSGGAAGSPTGDGASGGSPAAGPGRRRQAAGWTPLLAAAAAVVTLGSAMPVGYNIGVINTPAAIIKAFCNESMSAHYGTQLSATQLDVLWSIIVSVFLVGGMAGSMSGGWAADRYGRKGPIIVTLLLNMVTGLMFIAAKHVNSVELLLLARLAVGFLSGLSTSIVPMYLTELAPMRLRGALGVVTPLGINAGVLVGQFAGLDWVLGTASKWANLLALYTVMSMVAALLLCWLPESPKYLILVRGQEQRGVRELARVRCLPEELLSEELRAMRMASKGDAQAEAEASHQGEWTASRVFRAPELVLPLVLVCALQAGQQLSGINAVFYYSNSVFRTAGLDDVQTQYATLGCGSVNLVTAVLALPLVNGSGRRVLMLVSTLSACFCLALLGTAIITIKSVSWMPYVAIASVLLYVLVYGLGMGPIPYFIGSELFDVGPRPVGMAFGSLSNWGGNFIVGISFPSVQAAIGPASFYIFAAFTFAQAVLLQIYLPETKGRDTAEVANMMRLGFKSKVAKRVPTATHDQNTV